jgi:hypothetical protein
MSLNRKDISTSNRRIEMQHRHFAAIASALRDSKPIPEYDESHNPAKMAQWKSTVNSFIVICRSSNARFNAERFLAACNYEAQR